jgi:hypothetical protein
MSTVKLREEAEAMIDMMSGARLRVVSEFLAFIKDRPTDAATLELLTIPGFAGSYARGMRDIQAGRTEPWRKVRSDV